MSSLQIDAVLSQIRASAIADQGELGAPQNDVAKRRALKSAVRSPNNAFANVLKQGLDSVNQTQAARLGPGDQVRAGRARHRAAASDVGNAEGQCFLSRGHRSAQSLR